MVSTDKQEIIDLIKGRNIKNVVFSEKYIRLELDDEIKLEVEAELPGDVKMGVYASQVKRSRVWL